MRLLWKEGQSRCEPYCWSSPIAYRFKIIRGKRSKAQRKWQCHRAQISFHRISTRGWENERKIHWRISKSHGWRRYSDEQTEQDSIRQSDREMDWNHAPSINSLRYKAIPNLFEATLEWICTLVGENDIFISIDDTIDRCHRSQVNFIIGILDGPPFEPMLVHVESVEQCNSGMITRKFIKCCPILWRTNDPPCDRVKLLWAAWQIKQLTCWRQVASSKNYCALICFILHA